VVTQRGVELVGEAVAGSADALAQWITALDHEAVDHAVEDEAVIEGRAGATLSRGRVDPFLRALRQADEVGDRPGRLLVEEPDRERALAGLEPCECSHASS